MDIDSLLARERAGYVRRTRAVLARAEKILDGSLGLGEWGEVKQIAHRISGSGGSYGLPEVSERAQEWEVAADALDAEACRGAMAAVRRALAGD